MKRKIAIAAGILVTAVSTISGSYAYYQDSVTVTNHISTGDVNIGIQEYEKDGDPWVSCSCRSSSRMAFPVPGSKEATGSSARMTDASWTKVLAMATRCFCPPDSSLG